MEAESGQNEGVELYRAAFAGQNHAIRHDDPRKLGRQLIALCGVAAAPEDIAEPRGELADCAYCKWATAQEV
ncbi:hypothetical protein [Saccharopolyspora sp. NPDC003762]